MADFPQDLKLSSESTRSYLNEVEREFYAGLDFSGDIKFRKAIELNLKLQMLIAAQNARIIELLEKK
jgi:hypothetical protein